MREDCKITDEEIVASFAGTTFGQRDHRRLVEQGVLKKQAGYRSGYTLETIMCELGLVTQNGNITKKGRGFIYNAFQNRVTG